MQYDEVKAARFNAARQYAEATHLPDAIEFATMAVRCADMALAAVAVEYLGKWQGRALADVGAWLGGAA